MSEMGPQVERRFVRSESPVNVVKSTAQPSEIKLFEIEGNNSQWKPTEK